MRGGVLNEGFEPGFKRIPTMFDRIKVGRIGGQKKQKTSSILNDFPCFNRFVKSSIVHHDGGAFWNFGEQDFFKPHVQNTMITATLKGKRADEFSVHPPANHAMTFSLFARNLRYDFPAP